MIKRFQYNIDGALFIWDLDHNYVEIYSENKESPKHLVATVPAGALMDMCSYVEGQELYTDELNFDVEDWE